MSAADEPRQRRAATTMPRFHQRAYYALKPFFPWKIRMLVRRFAAVRILKSSTSVWPIDASAGRPPAWWPGWPEQKAFAVALTHDVEGAAGLAKCRELCRLEAKLGFKSAFNFVPEGDYRVPSDFRVELAAQGFEIGVHDLKHDGKLFNSWLRFVNSAEKINAYLREWGASGYRSGFMLRNLDWLHALDIQYDSSTFDTDPFEIQPDGAGTIFPFWIDRPAVVGDLERDGANSSASDSGIRNLASARQGYAELPYTLPQDSTLFLLLRESSPEIWIRKLDWIAARGGMVLVNVHPDYIRFAGENPSSRTYPVEFYLELLEHIRRKYAGQYWHALPREIARFAARASRRAPDPATERFCKQVCAEGY
jgi:hypothetical protein